MSVIFFHDTKNKKWYSETVEDETGSMLLKQDTSVRKTRGRVAGRRTRRTTKAAIKNHIKRGRIRQKLIVNRTVYGEGAHYGCQKTSSSTCERVLQKDNMDITISKRLSVEIQAIDEKIEEFTVKIGQ